MLYVIFQETLGWFPKFNRLLDLMASLSERFWRKTPSTMDTLKKVTYGSNLNVNYVLQTNITDVFL